MRIYPPAWAFARTPLEDDVIGGYHIPAKSLVVISPYVTHRLPDIWGNPETFDPDRFLPERSEVRPRFAYYPFSAGPVNASGRALPCWIANDHRDGSTAISVDGSAGVLARPQTENQPDSRSYAVAHSNRPPFTYRDVGTRLRI